MVANVQARRVASIIVRCNISPDFAGLCL
jgi:hypothetical protein